MPSTRHVPRCGRTWHFELPTVCDPDAMQTHEESTALKTLPHASANWHGDCDPAQVIGVCSSATGRFLGPNCRTKKEQTGGVNHAEANSCNGFVSAHISGALPVHIKVPSSHH